MKQLMLEEQDNFWDTCYTVMLEAEHLEEYFSKMNMMFANKVIELPFGISREDFEEHFNKMVSEKETYFKHTLEG